MRRSLMRVGLLAAAAVAIADCGRSDFISHADPPHRVDVQARRRGATVRWDAVPGAAGYRVYAAPNPLVAPTNYIASGGTRVDAYTNSAQFIALSDTAQWFFVVQSVKDHQGGDLSPRVQTRPLGLGTSATSPTFAASTRIDGDQPGSHFGYTVDRAGDVNGDGYDDIIVGTPNRNVGGMNNVGRAQIFLGGSAGISTIASWTVEADTQDVIFGLGAVGAGDVNRDGFDDVLVCTPKWLGGEALLYLGRAGGPLTTYSLQIPAPVSNTEFGNGCAGLGDVNGDGYDDIAVGAPLEKGSAGAAYVYLGGPTGLLHSTFEQRLSIGSNGAFGFSVARAGDVDGDGLDDLVVGANNPYAGAASTDVGHVYVFRGTPAGVSTAASFSAAGDQAYGLFGYSVKYAGDIDGNGFADLAVGASLELGTAGQPNSGRATMFFSTAGNLAVASVLPGTASEQNARGLATAGDLDGNGTDDLLVGGYAYSGAGGVNQGRVRLYSGGLQAGPLTTLTGLAAGDLFGFSVARAGDVNADGSPDFVVSGFNADGQAGAVWVFYGPPHQGPRADAGPLIIGIPGAQISPTMASFEDSPAGSAWTCTWDFGDGIAPVTIPCTATTASAVTHSFAFPGIFEVRLTVTNVFGLSGQSVTRALIGQSSGP